MNNRYIHIIDELKAKCHAHNGSLLVQNGMDGLGPRGYWLLFESMFRLPGGTVIRGSQIHHSWAMQVAMNIRPRDMRKLSHFSFTYITKGRGRYIDNNHPKGIALAAGDLICMFPGHGHVYAPDPGTRWDEINVNFQGEVFNSWVGPNLLDPLTPIRHLSPIDDWLKKIESIILPLAKPNVSPSMIDTGKLIALMGQMCNVWQTPFDDVEVSWLETAKQNLRSLPLNQILDLNVMAKHFCIAEQTYRKKFKRLSGMTPSSFRAHFLIEQACHLLRDTGLPLKKIADDLGFGSEYYFSRRFKQIAGMPPGAYREKAISS